MKTKLGLNKHQKAARKVGELKVSRSQVPELLELSCSIDVGDRLHAAQYLCPCHIQSRIPEVWEAVLRMMEDDDRRVRFQAWHTWEDGGLPDDPALFARMEQIYQREKDGKVRAFAHTIIGQRLAEQNQREMTRLHLQTKPTQRGKCDFCGANSVPVHRDLDTVIGSRPAWICETCASA
ncbi:MAG: hypothetical protein U0175_34745 [Caldilineaceae bacterium]